MKNEIPALRSAVWVGTDMAGAPQIVRRFTLTEVPADTCLYITGLGWFEASLNGIAVTDGIHGQDKFVPTVTDYEKRPFDRITYPCRDTFTHRIHVCSYPAAPLLRVGENTLTVSLGGGFYRQKERVAEGDMSYSDTLKTVFALVSGDTVLMASDGSETVCATEITASDLFLGEVHDRTAAQGTAQPVTVLPAPDAIVCMQRGTPDRIIRRIRPRKIGSVDGRTVWDAGENISGVVSVTKREGTAVLRFAEILSADGALDFSTTGAGYHCTSGVPQIQTDTFIGAGTFTPRFVWHCFRYFDVAGDIDGCEVLVIHADTPLTASFSSASEGLNFLFDAFVRTQLDNMHGSYPSDCPHRERLGYTGDGQNCAEAAMQLLDSREFYRKWIYDILDSQSPDTGHIQHTAPFQGGGGGPGGWGCAAVIVPYVYWQQYGMERPLLDDCYAAIKKWIGYLCAHCEDGLVVREEAGGWCLGDWCTFDACALPEPFVNTYFFIRSLRMAAELAEVLGHSEDIAAYTALDGRLCDAMKRTYLADGHFCGGIQGADAYALDLGLLPSTAADALAARYDALGRFDTGFLGTDILLRVLLAHGHADTVYRLLTAEECGTFLYMKRHGATTVWEDWHGGSSHCHPMFGAPVRLLFTGFLGISHTKPGWEDIVIRPVLPTGLDRISGMLTTPRGPVSVALTNVDGTVRTDITLPDGVTAKLCTADGEVTVSNTYTFFQ